MNTKITDIEGFDRLINFIIPFFYYGQLERRLVTIFRDLTQLRAL